MRSSILASCMPGAKGVPEDDAEAVPEDDNEAIRWFRMAAEQGHAMAQSNLGLMYGKGEGVPKDDVQAYAWLSIAAAQGNESAKETTDIVTGRMTRAQIAEAQKLSREYWEAYGPSPKPNREDHRLSEDR